MHEINNKNSYKINFNSTSSVFKMSSPLGTQVVFKTLTRSFFSLLQCLQTGLNTNQCLLSSTVGSSVENNGFQPQSGALYAEKECLSTGARPGATAPPPPTGPGRYPSGSDPHLSLAPYPCRHTLTYEKIAGATFGSTLRSGQIKSLSNVM